MSADFWTVVSALGSAGSAVGTTFAAVLAGKIAWYSTYGAKPWISRMEIGRKWLDFEKTKAAKSIGLSITNRQKVDVTAYRVDVIVPGETFTGKVLGKTIHLEGGEKPTATVHLCEFEKEKIRFLTNLSIPPGKTLKINFLVPANFTAPTLGSVRYMVWLQRDEPFVRSFWITREVNPRKANQGLKMREPWSPSWTLRRAFARFKKPNG